MRPDPRWLRYADLRTVRFLAAASGIFSLAVILAMIVIAVQNRPMEHFESEKMLALREALRGNPDCEAFRQAIREEDVALRQAFARSRTRLHTGAWMLLCGAAVFVLSLRRARTLAEPLPIPLELGPLTEVAPSHRRSMAWILSIPLPVALGAVVLAAWYQGRQETAVAAGPAGALVWEQAAPFALPDVSENQRWPQLRGQDGMGRAVAMDLPTAWNAESGENILWKVPLPGQGNSSPVVWADRVFLTGASAEARQVYCFAASTGDLLWTCNIQTPARIDEEMNKDGTGLAAPTAVVDGERVYAYFGTAELAAVDFEGNQVWARWLGAPDSLYGIATSLAYHRGKVLLQFDQDRDEEDRSQSFLYAIDARSGDDIWKVARDVSGSWSSPLVVDTGERVELVTAANPWVVSYDPDSGSEWWKAEVLSGDVAPMPVFGGGFFFTVTEYSQLSAIRAGGAGNITDTHLAWMYDEDLPDVASPVTDGRLLLLPTGSGTTHCFEVSTGKVVWTEEFAEGFWSSPILVGEDVYLTDKTGVTYIFKLADRYASLGQGSLGEPVFATPAFADNRIYIRTEKHLVCIGKKP